MTPTTIFLFIAAKYIREVTGLLRAMIDLRKQLQGERKDDHE